MTHPRLKKRSINAVNRELKIGMKGLLDAHLLSSSSHYEDNILEKENMPTNYRLSMVTTK
jgi:hypothetical protein